MRVSIPIYSVPQPLCCASLSLLPREYVLPGLTSLGYVACTGE